MQTVEAQIRKWKKVDISDFKLDMAVGVTEIQKLLICWDFQAQHFFWFRKNGQRKRKCAVV